MVNRRIHTEISWVNLRLNYSSRPHLYQHKVYYILCMHTDNFKTSVLPDAVLVNFDWTSWASKLKERRKVKLKDQLEKGMLPLFCQVHRSACFPTLDVILWDGKPKTRSELQNINIWKPGRFDLVGLGFAGFDKHFYRECARSKPLLHVFKKTFLRFAARRQQADVLYANAGIGFCKYEARKNLWTTTFALPSQPGWNMAARAK